MTREPYSNAIANCSLVPLGFQYNDDKFTGHQYQNLYCEALRDFRHSHRSIRFLEIGFGCGHNVKQKDQQGVSSLVWKQYFTGGGGSGVQLYEVDYRDQAHADCVSMYLQKHPGIAERIYLGDQSDKSFLNDIVANTTGRYDVVIDDGGHKKIHQLPSFEVLWEHVQPGGLYFIEDLDVESSVKGINRDILGWLDMLASARYPSHPSWTGRDPIKWVTWPWTDLPRGMVAIHVQAQIAFFRKAYPSTPAVAQTAAQTAAQAAAQTAQAGGADATPQDLMEPSSHSRHRNYWQVNKCSLEGDPHRYDRQERYDTTGLRAVVVIHIALCLLRFAACAVCVPCTLPPCPHLLSVSPHLHLPLLPPP